jgi:hypothetical protein
MRMEMNGELLKTSFSLSFSCCCFVSSTYSDDYPYVIVSQDALLADTAMMCSLGFRKVA